MTLKCCDILITPEDHEQLMAHLFPGDRDEHGAVLHAGIADCDSGLRLFIKRFVPANLGTDYVKGELGYRALSPSFIHRQIIRCRDDGLAYLAVHNHCTDNHVKFSKIDLESHERGYPALLDIGRGVPVGAVVFGSRAAAADIWLPNKERLGLRSYRVIGRTIKRFYPGSSTEPESQPEYDRQVRMFGPGGQALLGISKIAVVGLGGIGSLIAEQLARLGVGHLVLIDPDRIECTNLSRVVGATALDVETGLLKTQIAVRHAREIADKAILDAIPKDVTNSTVAKRLRDCDFIFLAADSMRARLLINALVHQYYIPSVQVGSKIRSNSNGTLEEAMCAVRQLRPGKGCLWCNELIDSAQLAIEAKTDDERKRQAYGVNEPNPSVITLNAVAAAHAVNDFLFDFLEIRPNSTEYGYQYNFFLRGVSSNVAPRRDSDCNECGTRLGLGDLIELPTTSDRSRS